MSRSGQNGGGQGGRNHRFNWGKPDGKGAFAFGDWRICIMHQGSTLPWAVFYKDEPMLRRHGDFEGYRRFKTAENAQRWVELRSRRHLR